MLTSIGTDIAEDRYSVSVKTSRDYVNDDLHVFTSHLKMPMEVFTSKNILQEVSKFCKNTHLFTRNNINNKQGILQDFLNFIRNIQLNLSFDISIKVMKVEQ